MKVHQLLSYLVCATLSCQSHALPTHNVNRIINRFECTPSQPLSRTRNGPPWGCAQAVLRGFYMDSTVGQFHRDGADDIFRLPRTSASGLCYVTLDTAWPETTVEGRWFDVWTVAQTMNTACTYYRIPTQANTAVTGGTAWLYQERGLVLTMEKLPDLSSNGSTVETE